MKSAKTRLLAGLVTLGIIISLLVLGPAQAYILGLSVSDSSPSPGEIISFVASAEFEPGDSHNATLFTIKLSGPETASCSFLESGAQATPCAGFEITKLSSPDFGYGYGSGTFSYNITLDTASFDLGLYHTELTMQTNIENFTKTGPDILIANPTSPLNSCSVRSNEGNLHLGNLTLTNNKVNFNIPVSKSANSGQGFVTSQSNEKRFSYKFSIVDILENDVNHTKILTSGFYTIATGKKITTSAILVLDKKNKRLSITSSNFTLEDSKVSFMRGC